MDDPSRYWLGIEEPVPWLPIAIYAVPVLLVAGVIAWVLW